MIVPFQPDEVSGPAPLDGPPTRTALDLGHQRAARLAVAAGLAGAVALTVLALVTARGPGATTTLPLPVAGQPGRAATIVGDVGAAGLAPSAEPPAPTP